MPTRESLPGLRSPDANPLPRLGIIGGGQLAKMTATAAAAFGCEVVILERQAEFPAQSLDSHSLVGDWDDPAQLQRLAELVDVVTLENEFVSAEALSALERAGHALLPRARTLALVRDKLRQKEVFLQAGIVVAAFADTPSLAAARAFGLPLVLKKRHFSYDGKGNAAARTEEELAHAWHHLDGERNPLYAERWIPFERELAVIVTRGQDGRMVTYPVVETINTNHICHIVRAPAGVAESVARQAAEMARRAVEAVEGIGSFGLEFFHLASGDLLLNEIAPRVHNTGHYTIEGCHCSQFENHVRAVLGWPLGSPEMVAKAAVMVNMLGRGEGAGTPEGLLDALQVDGAHVHVYGKTRSARGRKMGHVTVVGETVEDCERRARKAAESIRFGGEG